jgi:hypothetical protein
MSKLTRIATRIAFTHSAKDEQQWLADEDIQPEPVDKEKLEHDKVTEVMVEWAKNNKMPRERDYEVKSDYIRDIQEWESLQTKELAKYDWTREDYLAGFKKNLRSLDQILDKDGRNWLKQQLGSSRILSPIISSSLEHAGLTPWEAKRIASSFFH